MTKATEKNRLPWGKQEKAFFLLTSLFSTVVLRSRLQQVLYLRSPSIGEGGEAIGENKVNERIQQARKNSQAIEIKNLRERIEKLQSTRDDANSRANYYWHLYIDERNQHIKTQVGMSEKTAALEHNEIEIGRRLDALSKAAETIYLAYCGVDTPYDVFEKAEKVIVAIWDEFQNEGYDEKDQPAELLSQQDLPF